MISILYAKNCEKIKKFTKKAKVQEKTVDTSHRDLVCSNKEDMMKALVWFLGMALVLGCQMDDGVW